MINLSKNFVGIICAVFLTTLSSLAQAQEVSASELTLINASGSVAMKVEKDNGDGNFTYVGLIPAKTRNNDGRLVIKNAKVGDKFIVRNASKVGEGVLDIVTVLPTHFKGKNQTGGIEFVKQSGFIWQERQDGKFKKTFQQLGIENGNIRLYQPSEHLELLLPVSGGTCQFRYPLNTTNFTDLPGCSLSVATVQQIVHVGLNRIPLNEVRHVEVPDDSANLFSYDLNKVDPLDVSLGEKQQIFSGLGQNDTGYTIHQGAAFLRGLAYSRLSAGTGSSFSKMTYDASSLSDAWNIGLSVGAGDTKGKKPKTSKAGKGSFSYSKMTKENQSNRSYFSVSREARFLYSFKPLLGVLDLTSEFADAVLDLPLPISSNVSAGTSAELKANPSFGAYQRFVQDWGTHYASSVKYGGAVYLSVQYDKETISKLKTAEWNASVEGEGSVSGVPLKGGISGGRKTSQGFDKAMSTKMKKFQYVGGQGGPGSWDVIMENAKPTDVAFAPLTDLFHPFYFKNGTTFAELDPRRAMLMEAINAAYPYGDDPKAGQVRVFDFEIVSMELLNSDEDAVFGYVSLGRLGSKFSHEKFWYHPFDRTSKAGARVIFREGRPFKFDGQTPSVRLVVRTPNDLEKARFELKQDLDIWGTISDTELPVKEVYVKLSDIKTEKPSYGKWHYGTLVSYKDGESDEIGVKISYRYRETPRWMVDPTKWDEFLAETRK